MIGQGILDVIIEKNLVRSHCENVTVWKSRAVDVLEKILNQWSLPRKLNSLNVGESTVVMTDDYRKKMREIGACTGRGQIVGELRLKKAQVIIDDTLLIGVYVERLS